MEGLWWGDGGKTEGEWRRCGATAACHKCAILAHNPLLAWIVNQQSIPQEPHSAPDLECGLHTCDTAKGFLFITHHRTVAAAAASTKMLSAEMDWLSPARPLLDRCS